MRAAWDPASARRARSRNAAAAARPPRACARPAEASSSAATASSGPAAAWARCHARRSSSSPGEMDSASAACDPPAVRRRGEPVDGGADERMAEAHAVVHRDQTPRRPAAPHGRSGPCDRRPRRGARDRRSARRPRSAGAAASPPASAPPERAKVCSMRADNGAGSDSPKPPASSAGLRPRGSSSSASGLPAVSAMMRSRMRSSSGPAITDSSNARASS